MVVIHKFCLHIERIAVQQNIILCHNHNTLPTLVWGTLWLVPIIVLLLSKKCTCMVNIAHNCASSHKSHSCDRKVYVVTNFIMQVSSTQVYACTSCSISSLQLFITYEDANPITSYKIMQTHIIMNDCLRVL